MIKGKEKGDNVITIFVNDINEMNQKEKIKQYKEIITDENITLKSKFYKII